MLDLPILDVALAMVFIFFLLSVLTSGIVEVVMAMFQKRGRDLRWAIDEVLNDPKNKNWTELMYEHPLIDGLKKSDDSLPSYISADIFSKALIDVMIYEGKTIKVTSDANGEVAYTEVYPSDVPDARVDLSDNHQKTFYNFSKGVQTLKSSDVKTFLNNFIFKSKDYDELKDHLEDWYKEYMDRATGWYKKDLRKWLFVFGFIIAMVMNVDSITISKNVYSNKDLRAAIDYQAQQTIQNGGISVSVDTSIKDSSKVVAAIKKMAHDSAFKNFKANLDTISSVYSQMEALSLPIGWKIFYPLHYSKEDSSVLMNDSTYAAKFKAIWCRTQRVYSTVKSNVVENSKIVNFLRVLGWIFTAIAVSLGAPFWFDTMKKIVNVRSAGAKPDSNEGSK